MSDFAPDQGAPEEGRTEAELRLARKRIKELEALEAEAQRAKDLERRLAFMEAGINPSDAKAKYFVKGYEGELTAEAIRAEAEAAGLIAPPPPDPTAQAMARVGAAGAGAAAGGSDAALINEIQNTDSEAELMALLARHGKPVGGIQE